MALEPPLQPLSGEQLRRSANATQEARLDISARGFWGDRFSRSLFDVRVYHLNAPSAIQAPLVSQYAKHERSNCKRREYEQRVRDVEGASFVPLVFSSTGGMGKHGRHRIHDETDFSGLWVVRPSLPHAHSRHRSLTFYFCPKSTC